MLALEHSIKIGGKLDAALTCGRWLRVQGKEVDATVTAQQYAEVLVPEILILNDEDGPRIDDEHVLELLRENRPLMRT